MPTAKKTIAAPRLLLTAAKSGGGKTTFTVALLKALISTGLTPAAFKCGPDYIDPMFHSAVLGISSQNLDLFLGNRTEITRRLAAVFESCDIAVLEGVMGFYDGLGGKSVTASAYDVAKITNTPVIFVADCKGASLSVAAEILGFLNFKPHNNLCGILLNRVSPSFYPTLKEVIEAETGLPVMGYLPNLPNCSLESKRLGLIPPNRLPALSETLTILGEQLLKTVDLKLLLKLASSAPPLEIEESTLVSPLQKPIIAVARDEAFCFYYAETIALLKELGADITYFSPLHDAALPPNCQGLLLGGGYPELYAKQLSGNTTLLCSIRNSLLNHLPCVAEGGGFLCLHNRLQDDHGELYPMAGFIDGDVLAGASLQRFGYFNLTATADNLLCKAGESLPSHEFHYSRSTCEGTDFLAQKSLDGKKYPCCHATESFYGGFPQLYFSGSPAAAKAFLEASARYSPMATEPTK